MCHSSLLLLLLVGSCWASNYEPHLGSQVWRVEGLRHPSGEVDEPKLTLLFRLREKGIDFLHETLDSVSILVPLVRVNDLRKVFYGNGVQYQVVDQNVGETLKKAELIDKAFRSLGRAKLTSCTSKSCTKPLIDQYMSFPQMQWYLKSVAASYQGVTLSPLATTEEGRKVWMLKIDSNGTGDPIKIWIEGGIHAREWISPAVVLYTIDRILNVAGMRSGYEYYIVPMANPDGYQYSRTTDRFWRKNVRRNSGSTCKGVDLNRNWNFKWGIGASPNPCSEVYKGTVPFSEPETKGLSDEMVAVENITLVLAMHSYGQYVLHPWGWTTSIVAPNTPALKAMGNVFASATATVYGKTYTVVSTAAGLYTASGTTHDWSYGVINATYAYTIELRDTGSNGFVLPAAQIKPTCVETWSGFKALFSAL